ncbi:hypothetical protein AK830_g6003 [Neonectria ditissima]|uniref:Nephrocystin 3-like N-terminal domain-containing protein n=1 Tax=Neonectria ditissima TaxID=78410 RepID=A0A0P7BKI3_9HYPO|nr:hypothetical protein AK830_g6003 [Neonectria ditissima]
MTQPQPQPQPQPQHSDLDSFTRPVSQVRLFILTFILLHGFACLKAGLGTIKSRCTSAAYALSNAKQGLKVLSVRFNMSDPSVYTSGWICAIETEYLAAQLCLDEEHPKLRRRPSPNDTNTYTLGNIAEHNVVIAALPDGSYGTSSAATVAINLLRSFPNVRIGLMVGIGGGAPNPPDRDIRLGDIVVSSPGDGKGGVFQYDFGKTIQEQDFQETRFLNQPPAALRTALVDLKVEQKRRPGSLEKAISEILEKEEEELREELDRPDATSGNQLMKNALRRDELANKTKVLCFEMEAAGLMDDFPCLVVRGICDYSDTHKNDDWQGYAALAAAVYAKDLLKRIPPDDIEAEKRIADIVSAMIDVEEKHNDFIRRRQKGTGQWLLDSDEFHAWVTADKQTLSCPGIPGAGKTIITAIVIDYIQSKTRDDESTGLGQSSLPASVRDLYRRHRQDRTTPHFGEISETLYSLAATYSKVFIVVDALDECQSDTRTRFLEVILKLRAKARANIFATSRFNTEIKDMFEESVCLEIRATNEDVWKYLDGRMLELPEFVRRNLELREEIMSEIVPLAKGMFLLAQLHLNSLMGKISVNGIRTALTKLPSGSGAYHEAYESAMERIEHQVEEQRDLAKRVLSWITCARRQLIQSELEHALTVKPGKSELDEDDY